jgi:nicotinamidase-related amidase
MSSPTAVLVVDLQNEVVHPDGQLRDDLAVIASDLVASTNRLVTWARGKQYPVVWVRAAYRPGYIDAAKTSRENLSRTPGLLVDGTWGAEVVDGAGRLPDDVVITKKRMSAFYETDLDFVLRWYGVERVVVCGTSTNFSVESTVRDAHSRDYDVVVVTDATGSRTSHLHGPALAVMGHTFGRLVTVDDLTSREPAASK